MHVYGLFSPVRYEFPSAGALAVSPLDGYLYVATIGKDAVEIFDPKNFALIRTIWLQVSNRR